MTSRVFKEKGTACVWITLTSGGALQLSGQDFCGFAGTTEYEYFITVKPDDFATIRTALHEPPDTDIVEAMCAHADMIFGVGEATWLKSLGISFGFDNWYEFD